MLIDQHGACNQDSSKKLYSVNMMFCIKIWEPGNTRIDDIQLLHHKVETKSIKRVKFKRQRAKVKALLLQSPFPLFACLWPLQSVLFCYIFIHLMSAFVSCLICIACWLDILKHWRLSGASLKAPDICLCVHINQSKPALKTVTGRQIHSPPIFMTSLGSPVRAACMSPKGLQLQQGFQI